MLLTEAPDRTMRGKQTSTTEENLRPKEYRAASSRKTPSKKRRKSVKNSDDPGNQLEKKLRSTVKVVDDEDIANMSEIHSRLDDTI